MERQRFVRKNMSIYETQLRHEKKRTRRTVFYVFLFLFISLVFLAVCVSVFLNVKTVNINGLSRYTYDEVRAIVPIEDGVNIYSFDAEEVETAILEAFPYINQVEVSRDLPTAIEITVVEEMAYFAADVGGETYIMSPELKVLEKTEVSEESNLTVLSLNSVRRCLVGDIVEFVDSRTLNAVTSLYDNFANNYIEDKIVSVDVRSRFDIYINYDNRFKVYLGDIDNIDIKVRFLVGIIAELDSNAKGTIDVSNHQEAAVALS